MRRLARWTLNALTALSLLLCVATVATWVASYWHPIRTRVPGSQSRYEVKIRSGVFVVDNYSQSNAYLQARVRNMEEIRAALEDEGRAADARYDLRATPAKCPECGRAGEVQAGVGGFR